MKRLLRLVGGAGLLSLSPIMVSAATFVSVPIVLAILGSTTWLSIAVGQAVGELARVAVIWGWNSIGLTVVAAKDPAGRVKYYLDSLPPRLLLFVPVVAIGTAAIWIMPVADRQVALLMALVGAVYGLNAGWAFIGGREPMSLLIWDASPRALSTLVASFALFLVPSAAVFGWVNLAGSVLAVGLPAIIMLRRAKDLGIAVALPRLREILVTLRRGFPAFVSGFIMVARLSFAVVASPLVAPTAAVTIALGDKFVRWGNTGMTPLMQSLQVRIPRGPQSLRYRVQRGIAVACVIGPVIGAAAALVVPWASPLISHGQIVLGFDVSIPLGIAVSMIFIAGITGNSALVLLGKITSVMKGATIALVVLAAGFIPLTAAFGAAGAFWAFALSETTVTAFQLIVTWRVLRERDRVAPASAIELVKGTAQ